MLRIRAGSERRNLIAEIPFYHIAELLGDGGPCTRESRIIPRSVTHDHRGDTWSTWLRVYFYLNFEIKLQLLYLILQLLYLILPSKIQSNKIGCTSKHHFLQQTISDYKSNDLALARPKNNVPHFLHISHSHLQTVFSSFILRKDNE